MDGHSVEMPMKLECSIASAFWNRRAVVSAKGLEIRAQIGWMEANSDGSKLNLFETTQTIEQEAAHINGRLSNVKSRVTISQQLDVACGSKKWRVAASAEEIVAQALVHGPMMISFIGLRHSGTIQVVFSD